MGQSSGCLCRSGKKWAGEGLRTGRACGYPAQELVFVLEGHDVSLQGSKVCRFMFHDIFLRASFS